MIPLGALCGSIVIIVKSNPTSLQIVKSRATRPKESNLITVITALQEMDPSVWATILALIWLHSSCLEQRDEWELIESKAIALVKAKAGKYQTSETFYINCSVDTGWIGSH